MSNLSKEERDKLPDSAFGDVARRLFPVLDQADLDAASHLIGKAESPDKVRARLIQIAKRLGLSIPDAWKEDEGKSNVANPGMQYKTFDAFEIKAIDKKQGVLEAIVSVFSNVDMGKDRILPGFFAKSLRQKLPKGVWMHQWDKPVAKTLEAKELLPGDMLLPESIRHLGGLYIKGQFNLDTQRGREAFSDIDFGAVDEFSIGYTTTKERVDSKTGVRDLIEGHVMEWSPVLLGMNPATVILSTKDAADAMSESDDTSGGALVDSDPMPQIGSHVKWGAYAKGMDPGCGSVKALFTSGEHGGIVATKSSPVASVYACKDMDEMGMDPEDAETKAACQCGEGEADTASKAASKCMMTKSIAHHPVDELDAKPGTPKPFADDSAKSSPAPVYTPGSLRLDNIPAHLEGAICELLGIDPATGKAADGGETPTPPAPSTKGALLGDTDEAMACAAFDRLHRILGYYVYSQLYSDADPDVVASSVGAAIDEYKGELLRMLGGILIANDPEDGEGTADAPTSTPAMQPDAYGYGMMSARADSLASKHIASLLSVFARSHDTSRDGVVTALALEGKVRALASEVADLIAVHARHQLLRKKEGRTLSSATRSRIKDVQEGITSLLGDLNALLSETEPKPKDEGKAAEAPAPAADLAPPADPDSLRRRRTRLKIQTALLGIDQ